MIGVGIIGAGFMGRHHFAQYESLSSRAKVVALCDTQEDRRRGDWSKVGGNIGEGGAKRELKGVKPYADWRELLADPKVEMIDICVPTYLHKEMAIAALATGKHVLCEKPMALTVKDCDEVLAAAAKAGGKFMIAQVIRFWPEFVYLRQAIEDRRFGEARAVQLRRQASTPDYSFNNWLLDPALSGGAILDLHVHDVDFALQVFGGPSAVTAAGYQSAGGSVDRVNAVWHFDRNLSIHLEGYWDMPAGFGFNMGFTAVFERAALVWDLTRGKPVSVYRSGAAPESIEAPGADGYLTEIEYFLDCIAGGRTPAVSTPQQSRDAVVVALAEKESILSGQRIPLPWVP